MIRKSYVQVKAAAFQGIAELTHIVRRQNNDRWHVRLDRSDLRHRNLVVGKNLQEKRFKFLIRLVNLVDQQDAAS